MASRRFMWATALAGAVAFCGPVAAADIDSGTARNWGGLWIGFGAGYAGTSASGRSSGDLCLSSSGTSGTASASATCAINDGRVDLNTQARAGSGDSPASASHTGSARLPTLRTRSISFVSDPTNITIETIYNTESQFDPPDTIYSGSSIRSGAGGLSLAGESFDISTPFGPLTASPGGGEVQTLAAGSVQASSESGFYGGASYSSVKAGGSSGEALAIGLGGLPSFDSGSETGGNIAPNFNARFDFQTQGNWIIGAELDVSIPLDAKVEPSGRTDIDLLAEFEELSVERGFEVETNALASARLRLGYAMDDFMIYGTGGLAYTNVDATATVAGMYNGRTISTSSSETADALGAVIGGGIAAFVSDNAAISLEGLYYKFDETIEFSQAGQDASVDVEDSFSVMMKFSIRAY